jgi:hypothetical protein
MTADIVHYIVEGLLSALLVYIAFRKAPTERAQSDGTASESYAKAAQISGQETLTLRQTIAEQEQRIAVLERKKFQVIMEFEIGDPPSVGVVNIKPILPNDTVLMQRSRRKV